MQDFLNEHEMSKHCSIPDPDENRESEERLVTTRYVVEMPDVEPGEDDYELYEDDE